MPDAAPPGISRADAIGKLDAWLGATLGAAPVAAADVPKDFIRGWEMGVDIDGKEMRLRLYIDARFPWSKPRAGLAFPPPFPSFPHVEEDGLICVLSEVSEADPRNPIGTAKTVLGGAERVLLEGKAGTNFKDFETEFLSYWNPTTTGTIHSILEPWEPSRAIRVKEAKGFMLAAETTEAVRHWVANRYNGQAVAGSSVADGLFLWLPQPLQPAQYPAKPDDVMRLACSLGAGDKLLELLRQCKGSLMVLFGAETDHGVCMAAVRLAWSNKAAARHVMKLAGVDVGASLNAGFSLVRYSVERADPWWVHGRDSNEAVEALRGMRVAIVGCGSLGSPLAELLAQAGVGRLDLFDPEPLKYENIARHGLGADSVGRFKAREVALRLRRRFPHSTFYDHCTRWQDEPELLAEADLIVGAAGSWGVEGELNELQLMGGLAPILYCWLEPHGLAAHAVLIGKGSGCLQCGMDAHGSPRARVVEFASETLRQVPACGAFFQPYGASATAVAAALAADLALDLLTEAAEPGRHHIASARQAQLEAMGASWSAAWTARCGAGQEGGRNRQFEWMPDPSCPACRGRGL